MKKIVKTNPEPSFFTTFRLTPGATYQNMPSGNMFEFDVKRALKQSLLEEQGYICCYCMKRINMDNSTIEHWNPQCSLDNTNLDYSNLFVVCNGNPGKPKDTHCDEHKGKIGIKYLPTDPKVESETKYRGNGEIYSDDEDWNKCLNDVLNLNFLRLVLNRKAVVDGVTASLSKIKGSAPRGVLDRKLREWNCKDNSGMFKEYCAVVIYYLKKRIAKLG